MSYPFDESKHTVCYAEIRHRAGHKDAMGWRREELSDAVTAEQRAAQLRAEGHESVSVMTPSDAAEWNAISFTRQSQA